MNSLNEQEYREFVQNKESSEKYFASGVKSEVAKMGGVSYQQESALEDVASE
jgi:hypothetical protein